MTAHRAHPGLRQCSAMHPDRTSAGLVAVRCSTMNRRGVIAGSSLCACSLALTSCGRSSDGTLTHSLSSRSEGIGVRYPDGWTLTTVNHGYVPDPALCFDVSKVTAQEIVDLRVVEYLPPYFNPRISRPTAHAQATSTSPRSARATMTGRRGRTCHSASTGVSSLPDSLCQRPPTRIRAVRLSRSLTLCRSPSRDVVDQHPALEAMACPSPNR